MQDFLGAFTRTVVSNVAPNAPEDRVEAAFIRAYASLADAGFVAKAPDLRIEFRHVCK